MNLFGNNKPQPVQPQPRRRRQRKNKWLAKAARTMEPTLDKIVQTNPLLQAAVLSNFLTSQALRIPETFIVVVNVTHDKNIAMPLKSHPVFNINVGFKNPRSTLYRMAMKPRISEIDVK